MPATTSRITFTGASGAELAARFDKPAGKPRACALFAHCFTCSKDVFAAKRIASELAAHGIATLRFDFTGLGHSDGDFASTNFSSNVGDLLSAVEWMRQNDQAPSILIGHSLGGAAVLSAAPDIPEVKAVATIGAPADTAHVVHNFEADIEAIERDGKAEVKLAGRTFTIEKQFLEDVASQNISQRIGAMKKALMVFHSPVDQTVGIENAATIYNAAKHPKSFVTLDGADHLLTSHTDAAYVAQMIASWSERYIPAAEPQESVFSGEVATAKISVAETGAGKFQASVRMGVHGILADEPESYGGMDTGPAPYDMLGAALGACTTMTLRMYADFKNLELPLVAVTVEHDKVHAKDCADCGEEIEGKAGKIDRFERTIHLAGDVAPDVKAKLIEIADKCPVHKTLTKGAAVVTKCANELA
ncbi:MAG: OsmC family protein [Rhizobiales bacterium]|nr:OsmC family protein [Hyphomicrobiales bacterium]MBO6698667.1 OsmC family protein [Hyphomicrobiales bacterium]MBO6735080.1 OsmC family protein [Hyphomicrobiales bacterium]MBO6911113.1 OsmC family protein [Hyphomicrobiales bacterium]MBO6955624.1 OsmC family protein [Hyphomicrobiales bacterium]